MNNSEVFDWIVIGGGIAGVTTSEILTREGHSVLLLEKNDELVSETSKVFHEWLHTGSLFTLVPDNLVTTRFVLGAIDDLLEYYHSFQRMNLQPTSSGLKVINEDGWFNNKNIDYLYRNRKNPVWLANVSRSIGVVNKIKQHDWLRRRAGSMYGDSRLSRRNWVDKIPSMLFNKNKFTKITSPDITMNSRILISDILNQSLQNGLVVKTSSNVTSILKKNNLISVKTKECGYASQNVLVCSPDLVSKLFNKNITTSYAPIAVVENVPSDCNCFVELDYYLKRCINLLVKGNGIGQAGGITVSNKSEIAPYMKYVINEHKKRNPSLLVIDQYVGLKKELTSKKQERNYLYHIEEQESKVWSLVLGKFTLAFSAAPEFYRRVYHKNPTKFFDTSFGIDKNPIISKTSWQEIIDNKESKNGND